MVKHARAHSRGARECHGEAMDAGGSCAVSWRQETPIYMEWRRSGSAGGADPDWWNLWRWLGGVALEESDRSLGAANPECAKQVALQLGHGLLVRVARKIGLRYSEHVRQ